MSDKWNWSNDEIKRVGYRVVDLISDYLTALPGRPVFRPCPPELIEDFADGPLPHPSNAGRTFLPGFAVRDVGEGDGGGVAADLDGDAAGADLAAFAVGGQVAGDGRAPVEQQLLATPHAHAGFIGAPGGAGNGPGGGENWCPTFGHMPPAGNGV